MCGATRRGLPRYAHTTEDLLRLIRHYYIARAEQCQCDFYTTIARTTLLSFQALKDLRYPEALQHHRTNSVAGG